MYHLHNGTSDCLKLAEKTSCHVRAFSFFTYPEVREQHYHSFGVVLVHLVDVSIHSLFMSVFGCTNC